MPRLPRLAVSLLALVLVALVACEDGPATELTATAAVPSPTSEATSITAVATTPTVETVTTPELTPTVVIPPDPTPTQVTAEPTIELTPEPTPTQVTNGSTTEPTPEPMATATAVMVPTPSVNGQGTIGSDVTFSPAPSALTTVEVVKLLTPSVVHIATETITTGAMNQPVPSTGMGTGVVLDEQGHILTNNHVVASAETITVTLNDGRSLVGTIVGTDPRTDLAVVRIEAEGLHPAILGEASTIQVGEEVIAIGHALGLSGGPTVTKGVVSALDRSINITVNITIIDMIQTDASINPGNSGGPLVNARGEVIGINTAIIQSGSGIGFAINVDDAKFVLQQLIENGVVRRGFLGVTPVNLTPAVANTIVPSPPIVRGVILARVLEGGPAEAGGLQEFDVIVQTGDDQVSNTGELSRFLRVHLPNETITIVFYRGDVQMETEVTLGERPEG